MKNIRSYSKSPLAWAMMLSLIMTPAAAFADKGGENESHGEGKASTTCLTSNCRSHEDDDNKNRGEDNGNKNGNSVTIPTISRIVARPGITRAVISWRTDKKTDTVVYYSTSSPVSATTTGVLSATGKRNNNSHSVTLRNLAPNTTYFFVVSSTDKFGNTAMGSQMSFTTQPGTPVTPAPDTAAPILSSITATPGTTTATVAWNTNEAADNAVFFATSLPVDPNATATQVVSSGANVFSHTLQLNNLSTSTTYFVIVRSRDAAGNVSTSSPVSFTTGSGLDTVAPTLTNVISIVGTSTLRFLWNTNELATSKVFFSTSTPVSVNSSTTPFIEDTTLALGHSVTLSGLNSNTLYHIVLQSKDSAGNIGSVIEFPVTTSQ